jgi:primary-amine oxidase
LVLSFVSTALAADPAVSHPVDGLIGPEYWTVYDVLRDNGKLGEKAKIVSVLLREPDKDYVLAWTPGQPILRKADVILLDDGHPFEGTVDITEKVG